VFVKRFIASDMQEAMRRINREFGPDAVILENRRVRQKGILGFFKKKVFEVVAAYEPKPKKEAPKEPAKEAPQAAAPIAPEAPREEAPAQAAQEPADPAGDATTVYMSKDTPEKSAPEDDTHIQLGMQMQELREAVQEFTNRISIVGSEKTGTYSSEILNIYNGLLECDVDESICKEIASQAESIKSRRDIDAKTVAQQLILDRLGDPMPLKLKKFDQNVLLFVGPTGAGKTTTLAKLAGRLKFKENLDVGLINTDTYRVGAMEHIRIFAEIMDIPVAMAYSAQELRDALTSMADKDVVLIDTAGKNARDEEYHRELQEYIEVCQADEIYLVLSVVTGTKACRDTIKHYSFIKDYKLIITKLDEAGVWGNVLNIADFSKKGISYITNGQNVPDDIRDVDTYRLVAGIVGDEEICYD